MTISKNNRKKANQTPYRIETTELIAVELDIRDYIYSSVLLG